MENNRRKQGGSTAEEAFFMEVTVETKTVLRLQSKYCPIKPSVATRIYGCETRIARSNRLRPVKPAVIMKKFPKSRKI